MSTAKMQATLAEEPAPLREPAATFLHVLRRNAACDPAGMAYRLQDADGATRDVSNLELACLVGRHAAALRALADTPAARPLRVVITLPQGLEFIAAFFACIAARAVAVPLCPADNAQQAQRIKLVLQDLGECVVLARRQALDGELAGLRRDAGLAHVGWLAVEGLDTAPFVPLDDFHAESDAIAMLQYTSGSTGQPRGVVLSNRNLMENSALINDCFGHERPGRRGVSWLPPHHDMGLIGGVLQPVYARFPMLLMPTSAFVRRPLRWLQAISDFSATCSGAPNFAFQMCVDKVGDRALAALDLRSWDLAFCGAEPINAHTLRSFAGRFAAAGFRASALYPCYGLAESTLMVAGKPHQQDMRTLRLEPQAPAAGLPGVPQAAAPDDHAVVCCGTVHTSLELRVVDPVLRVERREREIGELWVSGPSVAHGYWQQAEATGQTFGQRLPGRSGSFLRTGDLGFMADGQLYVTGRLKELLIVRGANHYPQDIEVECAQACPELAGCRAVAFPVPGPAHERLVLAVEVPRSPLDPAALARRINARLLQRHGLRAQTLLFVPRKTVRLTTSGKVQRLALRADFLAGKVPSYAMWDDDTAAAAAPAREPCLFDPSSAERICRWIIERIADVTRLDPQRIRRDDSFAELALDSVAWLELVSELEQQHRIALEPAALYSHNTPALLAQEIYRISQAMAATHGESVHAAG